MATTLDRLVTQIRACRVCVDSPAGAALAQSRARSCACSRTARLAVVGAGARARGCMHRAYLSAIPQVSGCAAGWASERGRVTTMCAASRSSPWGSAIRARMPTAATSSARAPNAPIAWRAAPARGSCRRSSLMLLVGGYAQRWHLAGGWRRARYGNSRELGGADPQNTAGRPRYLPMPHPSWRNNGWFRNTWFEARLRPRLRAEVRRATRLRARGRRCIKTGSRWQLDDFGGGCKPTPARTRFSEHFSKAGHGGYAWSEMDREDPGGFCRWTVRGRWPRSARRSGCRRRRAGGASRSSRRPASSSAAWRCSTRTRSTPASPSSCRSRPTAQPGVAREIPRRGRGLSRGRRVLPHVGRRRLPAARRRAGHRGLRRVLQEAHLAHRDRQGVSAFAMEQIKYTTALPLQFARGRMRAWPPRDQTARKSVESARADERRQRRAP